MNRQMIQDAVEDGDMEARQLLEEYLGRGMYGKTCFAITGTVRQFGLFLIAVAVHPDGGEDTAQDLANGVSEDSMGRGSVFYFPGFTLDDEEDD